MATGDNRDLEPNPTPDWPTLAARFLDDFSKMMQAEIHLAELGLRSIFQSQIDQIFAMLAVAGLLGSAVLCVLAAAVLLLHHWMEWWAAFALTALLSLAIAICVRVAMMRGNSTLIESH